jgi:hypothetical protein
LVVVLLSAGALGVVSKLLEVWLVVGGRLAIHPFLPEQIYSTRWTVLMFLDPKARREELLKLGRDLQ